MHIFINENFTHYIWSYLPPLFSSSSHIYSHLPPLQLLFLITHELPSVLLIYLWAQGHPRGRGWSTRSYTINENEFFFPRKSSSVHSSSGVGGLWNSSRSMLIGLILCRPRVGQLLRAHEHKAPGTPRSHCLLWSSSLSPSPVEESSSSEGDADVPFVAGHPTDTYSLHCDQLGAFATSTIYCPKEL